MSSDVISTLDSHDNNIGDGKIPATLVVETHHRRRRSKRQQHRSDSNMADNKKL
ncbi:hypothetical protein ACLOJK_036550, partial [Asimina triloba]